jgi:hypothetical protein
LFFFEGIYNKISDLIEDYIHQYLLHPKPAKLPDWSFLQQAVTEPISKKN